MDFLRENWWKILISGMEIYLILRFLEWVVTKPPKHMRVYKAREEKENDWDKPAA